MKYRILRFFSDYGLWVFIIAWLVSGVVYSLNAQEIATAPVTVASPAVSAAPTDDLTAVLVSVLDPLVLNHPWLSTVFLVIGLLRTLFKPIVSWLEARAAATPDTADDERLAKAEASWWFRALAWLLDCTASIKVGPQKR